MSIEQDSVTNTPQQENQANRLAIALLKIIFTLVMIGMLIASAFCQQIDKVQKAVDATKVAYYSDYQDYLTDGQRTVWVKSYKRWVPSDFKVMQKEAPGLLKFLSQAVQHNRYDALEQLLPDYYRAHGGAKAFADAVMRTNEKTAVLRNRN